MLMLTVAHPCNPSPKKAETRGSTQVQGQPGLHKFQDSVVYRVKISKSIKQTKLINGLRTQFHRRKAVPVSEHDKVKPVLIWTRGHKTTVVRISEKACWCDSGRVSIKLLTCVWYRCQKMQASRITGLEVGQKTESGSFLLNKKTTRVAEMPSGLGHCCSSRRIQFVPQHTHGGSQPPVTPAPGNPTPCTDLRGQQAHRVHIHTHSKVFVHTMQMYL